MIYKTTRLFLLFGASGILCAKLSAKPPLAAKALVQQAAREESKLQTGRVQISEIRRHVPQTDAQIKNAVGDGPVLRGALQIEKETPLEIVGTRTLLFDNRRGAVLVENSDNHQMRYLRVTFDKTATKSYRKSKNVTNGTDYIPTYTKSAPMPSLNDFLLLWTNQFWQKTNAGDARFAKADNGFVIVELPPRRGQKRFVTLDPRKQYAIASIAFVDVKLQRTRYELRVERTLRNGIWYPDTITETFYDVNAPKNGAVLDETIAKVQAVSLNGSVGEADLDFGPLPPKQFEKEGYREETYGH